MGTQGLISIVSNKEVLFKLVAGCNGIRSIDVVNSLLKLDHLDLPMLHQICKDHDFGSKFDLVLQSATEILSECDEPIEDLYITKFDDPEFNPRWNYGTADYIYVVDWKYKKFKRITR